MKLIVLKIMLSLIVIFSFTGQVFSQGLYSKKGSNDDDDTGSIKRAIVPNNTTPGGNRPDAGGDSPVGEGALILSLLAGGYAAVKKYKSIKENED